MIFMNSFSLRAASAAVASCAGVAFFLGTEGAESEQHRKAPVSKIQYFENQHPHLCTLHHKFDPNCEELVIFSGTAHKKLAESVANKLGKSLGKAHIGRFHDGEVDVKIEESVRGKDVYLIQPTSPPVNENLIELLLTVSCLRQASAKRVTIIVPYFGYMRSSLGVRNWKNDQTKSNENTLQQKRFGRTHSRPLLMRSSYIYNHTMESDFEPRISLRSEPGKDEIIMEIPEEVEEAKTAKNLNKAEELYEDKLVPTFAASDVAIMLEVVGAQRVVVIDLQTPGLGLADGFFRKAQVESIRASEVVVESVFEALRLEEHVKNGDELVVVAPHSACVPKAQKFRDIIQEKTGQVVGLSTLIRTRGEVDVVGNVDGKVALVVEDVVDTGATTVKAVNALKKHGAKLVYAYATHGLLSGNAAEKIQASDLAKMLVLDTVPIDETKFKRCPKLQELSIASVLADQIKQLHFTDKHPETEKK